MSIQINEIFYSIQGESLFLGLPCIFIRLTGCNLRCNYCDTQYAYHQGSHMKIRDILDQVSSFQCNIVEITGGEPLLQGETNQLIHLLLSNDYTVLLETNGTIDISTTSPNCIKIMDIKCPSSGEHTNNMMNNLNYLGVNDQVKFVISNKDDFKFAKRIIKTIPKIVPRDHIIFSPSYETITLEQIARWLLYDNIGARIQIQLHKYIWPKKERGI